MNRLFVVVLCRSTILVRVGPERRGATNKYLLVTRTSLKTPSCFLRSRFSRVREKRQGSNETLFFRSSLRFLAKEKQARVFRHEPVFRTQFFACKRITRL